jgi:hypothetical protein
MMELFRGGSMKRLIQAINRWFGASVGNAFGNPLEERQHQPPPVGVQPYHGDPNKH